MEGDSVSRLFTKRQKQAVELVTGATGHGDHIVPHSKGGLTSVENCQLISQAANIKKGDFFFKPRRWQEEFFKQWIARVANTFLLIVIPGGGKTMAALQAARTWMAAGSDRRVIVVVPTDSLREQWREEAAKAGLDLQTKNAALVRAGVRENRQVYIPRDPSAAVEKLRSQFGCDFLDAMRRAMDGR